MYLLTGETHGYYQYYTKRLMNHLGHCLAHGFANYEDTPTYRKANLQLTTSPVLPPYVSIAFLQNHDQIGNRAAGDRLTTILDESKLTLAYAMLLLSPHIPMLFMGEEWWTKTPFLYFCDFEGELAEAVHKGRCREFGFSECVDPNAPDNFTHSTLDWEEPHQEPYQTRLAMMRHLLEVRREHIWPLLKSRYERAVYTIIEKTALDVRWEFQDNRLLRLIANFSDTPLEGVNLSGGQIIWGSQDTTLPAWSCAWSVENV